MVDEVIRFGVARLIRKGAGLVMAKVVFNAFKLAWIDIYLGLPDFIVYNYGINFNSEKFWILFKFIGSIPKLVPMEAHYLIGKVKRYH